MERKNMENCLVHKVCHWDERVCDALYELSLIFQKKNQELDKERRRLLRKFSFHCSCCLINFPNHFESKKKT